MSASELLLTNLGLVAALMTALWLVSLPLQNVSIVDIFWGPGFAVIAIASLLLAEGNAERQLLLSVLTTLWALRLGIYLAVRNIGHGEDYRYAQWRAAAEEKGQNFAVRALFRVFLLQGMLMWIIALPVQLGQVPAAPALGWAAAVGTLLWLLGFLFEAIGDWQLRRFKSDPDNQGKVMDRGLWRYTRHPNYFGNACLWWGLWLIAVEAAPLWTILSPAIMTFLLMKVSGVSLLEQSLKTSKPGYEEYVKRTNAFFPGPPRTQA